MRLLMMLSMVAALASPGWGQINPFGSIMFPGTPPGTGGITGGGAQVSPYGSILFPGTGTPAAIPPGTGGFTVNYPQTPNQGRPGSAGVGRLPITRYPIGFPVFYGGGYYPYQTQQTPKVNTNVYNYQNQNVAGSAPNSPRNSSDALSGVGRSTGGTDQSPVVILNQYFLQDEAGIKKLQADYLKENPVETEPADSTSATKAGIQDDISRLFLFALKNGEVLAASAYWVDGATVHYITNAGVKSSFPLDSVNRDLSERLNAGNSVAFGLPSSPTSLNTPNQ